MKKILFVIAIVMTMAFNASAQDFFIRGNESDGGRTDISGTTPALPHGGVGVENGDQPAPLGSGLLILTALGAGYALSKKRS